MIKVSPFVCSVQPSPRWTLHYVCAVCLEMPPGFCDVVHPPHPSLVQTSVEGAAAFLVPLPSSIHPWLNVRKLKWYLLSFKHSLLKSNMKILLLSGGVSCFPLPLIFNCWRLGCGLFFFVCLGFFSWYLIRKLDLQLKNWHKLCW